MNRTIRYSVILPVCHGGEFLQKALSSFEHVEYDENQVEILVAGHSDDARSRRTVHRFTEASRFGIFYIPSSTSNRSRLLNSACRKARGRYYLFADDDCQFQPDWLNCLDRVLSCESHVGLVGGRDKLVSSHSAFSLSLDVVLNSFMGTGGVRKGKGLRTGKYYPRLWNMMIPARVAQEIGGRDRNGLFTLFDEELDVHEDVSLADDVSRSGWRIIYAPEVLVYHFRDTTFKQFVKRNFRMGQASRRLRTHRIPHIILAGTVIAVPVLGAGMFFFPFLRLPVLLAAGIYAAALLVTSIKGAVQIKKIGLVGLVPLMISALHGAKGLGYLFPRLPVKEGHHGP